MKKEFFASLKEILYNDDLDAKFASFADFYDDFKSAKLCFNMQEESFFKSNLKKDLKELHPTKIRRSNQVSSIASLAKLIHSVAHIEFSAVNLALDAAYRFKGLPSEFYNDWLEVAQDEIKHFGLLNKALSELGYHYGSFAVHSNLEQALFVTKDNLSFRMGVVHRGLEAKGLDANPFVVNKLKTSNHPIKPFLLDTLEIILNDEINHVKKGDFWWQFSKDESDDYLSLCAKFKDFVLAGKVLNVDARLRAGFNEDELKSLESFYAMG